MATSTLSAPTCGLPGCTRPCFAQGDFCFDYCGRTHAKEAARQGIGRDLLDPPSGACYECALSDCQRAVYIDPDTGRTHDFCSRTHAAEARRRGEWPRPGTTGSRTCSLPGCAKQVYRDPQTGYEHDYCGADHACRAAERGLAPVTEDHVDRVFDGAGWTVKMLKRSHPSYDGIKRQFLDKLLKDGTPVVERILQVEVPKEVEERYTAYAGRVGNIVHRFHGTALRCNVGVDLGQCPCCAPNCNVCSICTTGFDQQRAGSRTGQQVGWMRYGPGIYFSATSGKSNDYAQDSQRYHGGKHMRAMFLCYVAAGKVYKTTEDLPDITEAPAGFDSVVGEPSAGNLNYDELVVYNSAAAIPSFLIIYSI